jgi:hypothetical protein
MRCVPQTSQAPTPRASGWWAYPHRARHRAGGRSAERLQQRSSARPWDPGWLGLARRWPRCRPGQSQPPPRRRPPAPTGRARVHAALHGAHAAGAVLAGGHPCAPRRALLRGHHRQLRRRDRRDAAGPRGAPHPRDPGARGRCGLRRVPLRRLPGRDVRRPRRHPLRVAEPHHDGRGHRPRGGERARPASRPGRRHRRVGLRGALPDRHGRRAHQRRGRVGHSLYGHRPRGRGLSRRSPARHRAHHGRALARAGRLRSSRAEHPRRGRRRNRAGPAARVPAGRRRLVGRPRVAPRSGGGQRCRRPADGGALAARG